jgi:hypothetical protein
MTETIVERHRPGRRTRIVFLVLLLIVLLIVGLFFLWSHVAGTRLSAQAEAYHAAGEPIYIDDFIVRDVAVEENAALELQQAATLKDSTPAADTLDRMEPQMPLAEKEMAAIKAVLAENSGALDHVDAAMKRKQVDWQLRFASPAIGILLPHLNHQRYLTRLLGNRALLYQQQGTDDQALRDVQRLIFISRAVDHQSVLVTHLVSVGTMARAINVIEEIAPALRIGRGAGEATPEQVAALIGELLDEKPVREGFHNAMLGERMMQFDTARCVADGTLSISSLSRMTPHRGEQMLGAAAAPIARSDGLICIRYTTAAMRAMDAARDWPTAQKTLPPLPQAVIDRPLRHFFAKMMLPSFERAAQTHFRCVAESRLAATALALRWYAAEHRGALPAKLDELVPKYLPSVPLDPFRVKQPIRYINDPAKPLLYSVGSNGVDDGGNNASTTAKQDVGRWDRFDAVMYLTRQPRKPPVPDVAELDDGVGGLSTRPATAPATR